MTLAAAVLAYAIAKWLLYLFAYKLRAAGLGMLTQQAYAAFGFVEAALGAWAAYLLVTA